MSDQFPHCSGAGAEADHSDIAAVPGVDILLIGSADLTAEYVTFRAVVYLDGRAETITVWVFLENSTILVSQKRTLEYPQLVPKRAQVIESSLWVLED